MRGCSNTFRRWYADHTEIRSGFLKRCSEKLHMRRRAHVADLVIPWPHAPLVLSEMPPLAVLARQPDPPRRYLLFPSRSKETFSVVEILKWYADDPGALHADR